jgi:hypothetical protein
MIGDGLTLNTAYRAEIRRHINTNFGIQCKQHVARASAFPCGLLKVDLTQAQHDEVMAEFPQTFSFPTGALDRTIASIPANLRTAINNKLTAIDLDTSWITGSHTVRDVLKYIAHTVQMNIWAGVNVGKWLNSTAVVGDVPSAARQKLNRHLQDCGMDTSWITLTTPLGVVVNEIQKLRIGTRLKRPFYHDEEDD